MPLLGPKRVAEAAKALVRLKLEQATLKLKKKVVSIGIGVGLAVAAAVFAVFAIGFGLATLVVVFATFLSTWLALLIVTCILFAVAALFAMLAARRFSK